ncbi:MAG TPA: diguanylate cyclase [Terriglobales bacterium]|nr:diguanylate cyclase [Terriglobales bacterium]
MVVLFADDSPVYRKMVPGHLEGWGFQVEIACNGAEAWQLLSRPDGPRLALLDWVMPDLSGLELCRRIRSGDLGERYVYTILLTGNNQKSKLLEGLQAGADDFLTKPFDPLELQARVLAGKRILDVQRELTVARERLRYTASHDSLTGLWNRAEITASLSREIARSKREGGSIGVILGDLDHFKAVNDTLGHAAGDEVLKVVANRLRLHVRSFDGVGRYGGEEFLIILPGCNLEALCRRAEQLRAAVANLPAVQGRHVTMSMGAVATNPELDGSHSVDYLLNVADAALYRAKKHGRNCVELSALPADQSIASPSDEVDLSARAGKSQVLAKPLFT